MRILQSGEGRMWSARHLTVSCGGLSSVVPGGGDPVEDSLPVRSLIRIPQTGGAQFQFDVGAEGDHANTDVPTEQVAESAQ